MTQQTGRIARNVIKSVISRAQIDGDGACVYRSIGTPALRHLDPFLMLDEFRVAPPGGFPDHPHRGFETVTYMMEGELIHEDFKGHKGHLKGGDLQWMTAGRGIIHSELLHGTTTARGLQLWVNLAAKDKMCEPTYQELESSQVTHVSPEEGIQIKVIAGEIYGARSSVVTRTPTTYIDVKLKKGKKIEHSIPANYTAFIYTLQGTALYGGNQHASEAQHTLVLDNHQGESTVVPVVSTSDDCHFVIIGGLPIGEPIVQHGPFVMNTRKEIIQAGEDFNMGRNGFEGAHEWLSRRI